MAFSLKKRDEKRHGQEQGLIDVSLMQSLQDHFCDANNLYLVCLNRRSGVVTKAYGSREELAYIHGLVSMDMHVSLMNRIMEDDSENVVEEDCGIDFVKFCGVSVKVGGEAAATWIAIGVMEGGADDAPESVLRTTPERYYKSLEFLEILSKQFFAIKMEELIAQEAMQKSRDSEKQVKSELRRNEVMTSIVRMLESESDTPAVAEEILRKACSYLDTSIGALLGEEAPGGPQKAICEYVADGADPVWGAGRAPSQDAAPFFDGNPYMISSGAQMPGAMTRFFNRAGIRAGLFLPIEAGGRVTHYACFLEKAKDRTWGMGEIKFANDVRRILQSIIVKRSAEERISVSYASMQAILENMSCGVYVKDPASGEVLYANQRLRQSLEGPGGAAFRKKLRDCAEGLDGDSCCELYSEGDELWFDFHRSRIDWVDGRKVYLCSIYDVTDVKAYQQKIERQANSDFLTGLYNRMRCEHDLEYFIQQTRERGGEGAVLYIDLDDFKHINDGLGCQYGDILLKQISDSLRQIPGVENNCYRVGGDEFIILLLHHQMAMLNRILDEISMLFTKPWMLKDTDYYCTMSMGVSRFPEDGDTVEELIKKADIALSAAKRAGKNRVEFYDDNVEATSFKRLDLEKNMRNATLNALQEFEVYYQPIVDITREGDPCIGAEALIRWNSTELGLISPTEFIPLAEYLGLINPIGDYVLREACKRCRRWNESGKPDYKVNVNLSVVQLLQDDIVERVGEVLLETGVAPSHLTLEVTESLAINDMGRMKKILSDIRGLGVCVALDDFGTGYSSLNHIRELPIDIIKIDRCFVIDIGKDDFSDAFVKMVAELANAIGVRVCVEGVETGEQAASLHETRIQMIQGFYYGMPMRGEEFEKNFL